MVYGMEHSGTALILVILVLCSAGCLETLFGEPPHKAETPASTTVPIVQSTSPSKSTSDLALQPSDLPFDYILQDRSVMTSPEVSQLGRDLGWRQGYFVSYYRMDSNNNVITRIRQSVSIFTSDSMNGVFLVEKEDLKNQQISPGTRYEIPFVAVGDRSIAFRDTNSTDAEWPVTYTVIFTKKNVYEKITMSGTNTDYETLKRLVQRAEALVQ
jgi:hypothetical protein